MYETLIFYVIHPCQRLNHGKLPKEVWKEGQAAEFRGNDDFGISMDISIKSNLVITHSRLEITE